MLKHNEIQFAGTYLNVLRDAEDGYISSDIWQGFLIPEREKLGLTIGQSVKVTRLVDKYGTDNIHPIIQAYEANECQGSLFENDLKLTFGGSSNKEDINQEMLDKIQEYENYAQKLLDDTKAIEKKTQQLSKEVYDLIHPAANAAANVMRKTHPNMLLVAGGILALASIGNWLYEKEQKDQRMKEYQRKMRLLQEEKRKEAEQRLPTIIKSRTSIRSKLIDKYEELIQKDFDKSISNETELNKSYRMFKHAFSMKMRVEYLDAKLEYIENELRAWESGKTSACNSFPLLAQVVDKEINKWFNTRLTRKKLADIVKGKTDSLILPYVLLISEPYLLRRHVGICRGYGSEEPIDGYFDEEGYGKPIFSLEDLSSLKVNDNMFVNIIKKSDYITEIDSFDSIEGSITKEGVSLSDMVIAFGLFTMTGLLCELTYFIVPILVLCFFKKTVSKIFPVYYQDKKYSKALADLMEKPLDNLYNKTVYNTI